MAAKNGVKPAVKAVGAKPAAAPKTPEVVEKSTAFPGVGAPADNTAPPGGESETDKAAREADEKLMDELREEAERLNREWDDEAARVLAEQMGLLEDEARAEDLARAESLKTTQTTAEEGANSAVTLTGWVLPEISEFPATITLENHTRNRVPVAGAQVVLASYEQVEVTVTGDQFARLAKALTSSARAHKWDNLKGLQVKYDRKD
jgi:hypothetical protein